MAYTRLEAKLENQKELMKALKDAVERPRKVIGAAVKAGGEVIADDARGRVTSKRSGKKVSAKITARKRDHITVSVGPTKKHWYLRFLGTGTARHEIRGKPFLRFLGPRGLVEVRRVIHPGSAARPWLRPAFDARSGDATNKVGEVIRAAIEEAKIARERGDEE